MLTNYLKVTFRILARYRFFSVLNFVGLSTSLACCVVICLFIQNELSYDRFHEDGKEIYRVIRRSSINSMPYHIGITSYPFADALLNDFGPHVKKATRVFGFGGLVKVGDKAILENHLALADSNFFTFFSYPLAKGNPSTVLRSPNSIVLSADFANKYFGKEDPIGKVLRIDDEFDVAVTGVMGDLPGNTHLHFDAVASIQLIVGSPGNDDWWSNRFNTYVNIPSQQSRDVVTAGLDDFMDKYFAKDFARIGNRISLELEPLEDIYFNYDTRYERNVEHGDRKYTFIFGSIGILILIIAAINYINLASAQATFRAREVGVRKIMGSSVPSIVGQFLLESFLLVTASMIFALFCAQLIIPVINGSLNMSIPNVAGEAGLIWIPVCCVAILSTLAGTYPALLLSAFKPLDTIKGAVKGDIKYAVTRKGLVILQFCISVFMVVATLSIDNQMKFMSSMDPGFDRDQVMIIRINNEVADRNNLPMQERLLNLSGIASVASASAVPGGYYDASTVRVEGIEDDRMRMRTLAADDRFFEVLRISIVAGRSFSTSFPSDTINSVMLNETAVKQLGWSNDEAIGKRVLLAQIDSSYRTIVGVAGDYNFISVKEKIEPLVIFNSKRNGNILIRTNSMDVRSTLSEVENIWKEYSPDFPIELSFLDQTFEDLQKDERAQGKMFEILSAISLFIACLGILGLIAYIASQRKKEIGIRKVIGATALEVAWLLMRELLLLVFIAAIIAIPIVYFSVEKWSEQFAYRAPVQIWGYIVGAAFVMGIAAMVVGVQSAKAAFENPVKFLRSE